MQNAHKCFFLVVRSCGLGNSIGGRGGIWVIGVGSGITHSCLISWIGNGTGAGDGGGADDGGWGCNDELRFWRQLVSWWDGSFP